MIPDEKAKALLNALTELEAWAGGLLDKCTHTRRLIEQAGAVSTAPKRQPVLTQQQLAEISAKQRARMLKRKP